MIVPSLPEVLAALPEPPRPLKPLRPSFIDPSMWRQASDRRLLNSAAWRTVRTQVLERDGLACVYCGQSERPVLEVNHISGNSRDNRLENLESVCVLCHRVLHAGRSAAIFGSLLLFARSAVDQNTLQRLCWLYRTGPQRLPDRPLMELLGLAEPRPFRADHAYLMTLRGYVVERFRLLERTSAQG